MPSSFSFEPVRYKLCWIRESSAAAADVDAGLPLRPEQVVPALAGIRPEDEAAVTPALTTEAGLLDAFRSLGRYALLPVPAERRLSQAFGRIDNEESLRAAREDLQVLVRLAAKIRRAGPPSGPVEVHLPFLDRHSWHRRFAALDSLDFASHAGRLIPRHYLERPQALTEHQAMLAACAVPAQKGQVTLAGFDRAIPGHIGLVLRTAPPERHPSYFPAMCGVTVTLQRTLRRWMEQHWMKRLAEFADSDRLWPILAYIASSPFPGRRPNEFTHDFLNPTWIYGVLRCARPSLRPILRNVHCALAQAGMPEAAALYNAPMSKDVLSWVRRQRKGIQSIVVPEAAVVNAFILWAGAVRKSVSARDTAAACSTFANDVHCALRRLPGAPDSEQLGSLLLVEAIHALHTGLGAPCSMRKIVPSVPAPSFTGPCGPGGTGLEIPTGCRA